MKQFPITTLAEIIKAEQIEDTGATITGVSTDTRTIQPGDCFFAITGENFNGHDYLAGAFAKGASCAVISSDIKDTQLAAKPILKVTDTLKALGDFARQYRLQANFKVIAITGTVGKTTVRQIAYHVLSKHFRTHQATKSFNNNIGLPLTLLSADQDDEIVLTELGSNRPGEIDYLTKIALPDVALVTNVYHAHLTGLQNIKTITQEKISISQGLQPNGTLIINADFERLVNACRDQGIEFATFGKSEDAHFHAQKITPKTIGSEFTIDGTKVTLPLPGSGNIENALAAWAICSRFEIKIDDFAKAVKTIAPVPMRTELIHAGSLTILNDCYNANPASMKNALNILADLSSTQKRRSVFICGDMAELAEQNEKLHEELGNNIAKAKVQLLITVGNSALLAAHTAKKTAEYDLKTKSFKDTTSACNNLRDIINDFDIILVKGSRINKLEMAVEKLKQISS